jgi:endonuclease/exonuclease/phosphatase family metal-dependent hydrolase
MRIATYNVHGFPWLDPPIKQMVGWITGHCDIVALQEIWCRWPDWSAAFAAQGWVFLHPARESHFATLFGSGLAFAWSSERWAHRESHQYPFLAGIGLDMLATKGWFRLDLVDRRDGAPLRILNTHLQADVDLFPTYFASRSNYVRTVQGRQLDAAEKNPNVPTLLIGDMNTDKSIFAGFRFFPNEARKDDFTGLDRCAFPVGQPWVCQRWRTAKEAEGWSDHLPILWEVDYSGY